MKSMWKIDCFGMDGRQTYIWKNNLGKNLKRQNDFNVQLGTILRAGP